ncbi:cytochrome oxidase assembly protein 1 [Coniosporium tulheliwenetii]|uniref:Cytochrome oxidase assembly protein 1 n=1 Tax=Coniosporium tulheliwenetii TaxID=3383036 RepID=A0ACC2Z4B0_9PEZI|nr:cytochrome oxidase assembly protein 1 [Cladosporium sp. JES 115]
MIPRSLLRARFRPSLPFRQHAPHRTLIAAPRAGSGPLMERRPDRALPAISSPGALFLSIITLSTLAIFNYQKSSSSVVNSTLYALRTHKEAREALGDEIYFARKVPWVWGTIDQLHGRIDIRFMFETLEWSLKTEDGRVIELLKHDAPDPFRAVEDQGGTMAEETI